ncbi:MAG: endonuclease III [Erysipelotrichaceae bacterium]|nr:endonuclease III [Erysipelotrichaceae bacterium]
MSKKTDYILDELEKIFPDAKCELIHSNPFELVCAVSLSAQTTDERVNMVTGELFKRYPTPNDLANADLDEVEDLIKSIGLYHNKALNLIAMAKKLVEDFDSTVPSDIDSLCTLNGVGRKTANVVRLVAFDIPSIPVDTHVSRVSKRLGLANIDDDVSVIEKKLAKKVKKSRWNRMHHLFIFFGRYLCKAKNPECFRCPFKDICREFKAKNKR